MRRSLIAATLALAFVAAPAIAKPHHHFAHHRHVHHARRHAARHHERVNWSLVAFINERLRRFVPPTGKCPFGWAEKLATYYDSGSRTASGERFNPDGLTVAMKSHVFGQHLRVMDPSNGREVTVRHNDFGPATIADLDLSRGAARALGGLKSRRVCVRQ